MHGSCHDILQSVQAAWNAFSHVQLEKAFCSLNLCYEEVILHYGDNSFNIPHIGQDAIIEEDGILALRARARQASEAAISSVMEFF